MSCDRVAERRTRILELIKECEGYFFAHQIAQMYSDAYVSEEIKKNRDRYRREFNTIYKHCLSIFNELDQFGVIDRQKIDTSNEHGISRQIYRNLKTDIPQSIKL